MTTAAAADALDVTARAVRKAIGDGRLNAERLGGRWIIDAEALAHFRASKPEGNPR